MINAGFTAEKGERRGAVMKKPIAFKAGTTAIESLPLPIVHYSRTFLGFQEKDEAAVRICSCSYDAIVQYIEFRKDDTDFYTHDGGELDVLKSYFLQSLSFPEAMVKQLLSINAPDDERAINYLDFGDSLCHRCNKATPSYRYCHEMYGGIFRQTYGWYINQKCYELGIHPIHHFVRPDLCNEEVLNLVDMSFEYYKSEIDQRSGDWKSRYALDKEYQKQCRKLVRFAENEVRLQFDHKKIGDAWTSETILFSIIKRLFPGEEVLRHYRPGFLEGLELDVFLPGKNLGVEYQGIQHFKPIAHWGGKEALLKQKERDKKKKALCDSEKVKLLYFDYKEPLSEDVIQKRIAETLSI